MVGLSQEAAQVIQGDHNAVNGLVALGVVLFYHTHRMQRHRKYPSTGFHFQGKFLADGIQVGGGDRNLIAESIPVAVKAVDHIVPLGA